MLGIARTQMHIQAAAHLVTGWHLAAAHAASHAALAAQHAAAMVARVLGRHTILKAVLPLWWHGVA